MHLKHILLTFLLFSGFHHAYPQDLYPHPPIRISEENGLSSNLVSSIHQSPDGLVWVGTRHGLTRYDGNRCTVFFPNDEITAICSDSEGRLYVGTEKNILNIHEGRIDTLSVADNNTKFQHICALAGAGEKVYLAFRAQNGEGEVSRHDMELSEERLFTGYIYRQDGEIRYSSFLGYVTLLPKGIDPFRFFVTRDSSVLFGGWSVSTGEPVRILDSDILKTNGFSHITGYTETPEGDILYTKLTEPHLYRYSKSSGKTTIETTFDFTPQTSLQGRDDIIYVGYGKGLIRYHYLSGHTVRLLSDESINELMMDSEYNIWAGTDNGVFLFSYRKDAISFTNITTDTYPSLRFTSKLWGSDTTGIIINDAFTGQDGRVWASTANSGIVSYDKETNTLFPDTYCLKNNPATSISYYNRKRETIFTCKHYRYDRFDLNEKKWYYYAPDIDDSRTDFSHSERINLTTEEFISKDIVYMEDDANWLVTPYRLVRHNLNDNSITTILKYRTDSKEYFVTTAYPSHTDAEQMEGKGYFYIGVGGVLYRIDVASGRPSVFYRKTDDSDPKIPPLYSNGKIFETGSGKLIFGSGRYSDGIFILDPVTKKITLPDIISSKKKILHNIIEDRQGNIFLYYSNPARLAALDTDTWKEKYAIPCGAVKHLLLDNETLWICGSLKPLIRYNTLDSTDVSTYMYDESDPASISTKNVMKIIPLKDSLYLLEGWTHLILFNAENQTFDNTFFNDPVNQNHSGTCICRDTSGRIWYGSRKGLSILDVERHSIRTYQNDIHFPYHLSETWINDITSDSNGNMWVGTHGNLFRYDPLKDSLLSVEPFAGKDVRNITEDLQGRLWIATSNGLFCKFSPDTDSIRRFPSYLGLRGNSYNSRSVVNPDGSLSFDGPSGWVTFHPDTLNSHTEAASIIITDFKINGKQAERELAEGGLNLSHSNNSISFFISSDDFIFNKYLEYRYRIQDIDNEWIYTKAPFLYISYPSIPAGRHILEMEVTNRFGEWGKGDIMTIPIRVRYPLWFQWRSIAIYLILLYLILRFIIRFKEKKHLLEKKRLETMVAERTSDLQREVNLKNKFFSILSHDLKSPINGAAFTIDIFLRQYDHIPEEQRKDMLDLIHMSLISSSDMLNSIMLWRQSQATDIKPNYQKINLKDSCRQVGNMHSAAYHKKDVSLEINIPDHLFVLTDKNILSTILRNLLANALKYSYPGGRVILSALTEDDKVSVSVQDFGVGMDEQTRNRLFTIDETNRRKGTDDENGTGLGLLIISEFLKKLGESIKIESEPKKGSTFTFTLRGFHSENNQSVKTLDSTHNTDD